MQISRVNLVKNNDYTCHIGSKFSNLPKLKQLNKDTITFTHSFKPKSDLQLYRCIGESEFKALLNNETINFAYSTSDPKGWLASNWRSGFTNIGNKKNYFVTFKKFDNEEMIFDRRDDENDTRYLIDEYNLSNVESIRKGYNAHGELVYAQDFETAQKLDKINKQKEIKRLVDELKIIQQKNCAKNGDIEIQKQKRIKEIYDELGSYAKEFGEIVDILKPLSSKDNETKKLLLEVIELADRQEDLPFVRKTLREFLDDDFSISSTYLIYKYGTKDDIGLLLDISKSDKNEAYVGCALAKLADEEHYSIIEQMYLSGTPKTQNDLIDYFKRLQDKGKILKIARMTLEMYGVFQNIMTPMVKYECFATLEKYGTMEDIPLLELYNNTNAKRAIEKIKQRFQVGAKK